MQKISKWLLTAVIAAGLLMSACQKHADEHHVEHPAEVEHVAGSEVSKVTLTEKAMQRLDIQTVEIRKQADRTVVPYSSLIYDPQGKTWVYTSPQPRTFVRKQITIDRIDGDNIFLKDGPPVGTVVASIGVAELYGTEFEVGH